MGFDSADEFAKALKERGLDQNGYAYLCRERGEKEASVDEVQVYADVLGISVLEAIELFSHRKDALKPV